MNKIWTMIEDSNVRKDRRIGCFLFTSCLMSALAGLFLWLIFGRFFWSQLRYLLCFMGYPMVFVGFFGGILFVYNKRS